MFLRSLEIKNYRSLEHVELNRLGDFNVLIGRNNAGKSAVFGALLLLNESSHGQGVEWESILTSRDISRALELRLLFDLRPKDRNEIIDIVGTELPEERRMALNNSPFARQVEFSFRGGPQHRGLIESSGVRLLGEDGKWSTIIGPARSDSNVKSTNIKGVAKGAKLLEHHVLDVAQTPHEIGINIPANFAGVISQKPDEPIRWLFWRLGRYLDRAFFFNPFRHSVASLEAIQTEKLAQNGSNLAQVLHTLIGNDRPLFAEIERFIQTALPDVGVLQSPLIVRNTEVSFRADDGGYLVRLHDMGGGIEQLLMVATVLLTTEDESTIFLEEPESHLHAGAQRFLLEKLYEGNRQVFISTHSPTFINTPRPMSMYQIKKREGRTAIKRLADNDSLSEVLEDIGSRNSDVLLSDAVLFVEGPSDQRVFEIWGEKLGLSLEEHNITVVPMGGGSDAARGTRVRSDVLEGISKKAPVPHLFVLDRDERSDTEMAKLRELLGERVHLLQRRELENYLLEPRALLAALRSKHSDDATITEKIDASSKEEVSKIIKMTADSLYNLVLMKRIRAELAGLRGGLLPRDAAVGLSHKVHYKHFPRIIRREIESRISEHLDTLKIDDIMFRVGFRLNIDWADTSQHSWIAPGEEIVTAVFHHFGSEYKKPNDTLRIVREMKADEISDEIAELLRRVVALTNRAATNQPSAIADSL
jgi:predicted ATP-dependent endonuclease of OLD family